MQKDKRGNEKLNTEIKNVLSAADDKAQYDAYAKKLIAQKSILANILVKTVGAFKCMDPKDVVKYIEGEPEIGVVPIEPGMTNAEYVSGEKIKGFNTEDNEINEGMIRFDIIFYVRMPLPDKSQNNLSKIIINVECQKDEPSAYEILNRAIFYVSRLISSQKERDFVNSNYDDINQVFSIWICMNMKYNSMSHIHLAKDEILTAIIASLCDPKCRSVRVCLRFSLGKFHEFFWLAAKQFLPLPPFEILHDLRQFLIVVDSKENIHFRHFIEQFTSVSL